MTHRTILKTIFEPFVIVLAAVYFVIDALGPIDPKTALKENCQLESV